MEIRLIGRRVILKPLSEEDAEKMHEYSKEPKLNEYSGPYKASKSIKDAEEYIKKCNGNMEDGNSYQLGIYDKNNEKFMGVMGFFNLDKENKKGELGFWIARKFWNKGHMSEAVNLITRFIFENLRYCKVYVIFHELNKAVERILQKAGYKKESELEDAQFTNEKYYCDVIYATVNSN